MGSPKGGRCNPQAEACVTGARQDPGTMEQEKVHVRMLILAGVALLWMTAVFGRLTYLQLIRHSEYMAQAMRQQRHTIEVLPTRGAIYDRNMRPLAMSVPVQSAFAVPAEIRDKDMATRLLAGALQMPQDAIREKLDAEGSFVWIKRKMSQDEEAAVRELNLKGIYFFEENKRFYPRRDMASHVLGFVDVDEHGLGGIEHEYDGFIGGRPEKIVVMKDARQKKFDGRAAQQDHGMSMVLTIDEKIQYIAETELEATVEKFHAPAGSVIVQDPNTGAILALANWPKYNPNAATDAESEARMDRAISAIYEPGSTFKIVTLSAAFDQGLVRADEVFNCENGAIVVAGHRIHDHKPYGNLTVAEILANSSDVGSIKIALRLGPPKFNDYIHAFGFGSPTGIDLPGESRGLVYRLDHWGSFSIGSMSMGQEIGVTPLQMINAVSAIANGGLLYKPHVVEEIKRDDQVLPLEGPSAPTEPKRVIKPETAAIMRQLMEGVILRGTGKAARLDGWTAAGKTGTAQKIDPNTKRYSPNKVIASFTGFAPINNPAVTILVSVDSPAGWPHDGATVSAPAFKRIAERVLSYLDVPRDVPVSPKLVQTAYRANRESDPAPMEDDTPSDLAEQTVTPAVPEKTSTDSARPQVTVAVDEGGDIAVPDFKGKTMREVTDMCFRLGLNPVLVGSSLAVQQVPAPGSRVRRGASVTVEFGTVPAKAAKTH
jgi:cell division protein FtsI (penicillin-binding protein 3)